MFRLAQLRKRDKGNEQVQKYRIIPKLASDSGSSAYGHATFEEHLVTFQAEQSSHKGVTGKPMKKLLAYEMSKEAVAKKKSPSVIAKFIGLDGASSSKLDGKQNKGLWDKYTKRTSSVGADNKLSKKNSAEMDRIKNMFNYQEPSTAAKYLKSAKQRDIEEELAFLRKKNEEILRESEELRRKWRGKSNQEVLEEYLQEPDPLFIKHALGQRGSHSRTHFNHIALTRSTNAFNNEASTKGWKDVRETEERGSSRMSEMDFYERRDHRLLELYGNRGTHTSLLSSKIPVEAKEDAIISPRKMNVLKPSLGRTNNVTNKRDAGSRVTNGAYDDKEIICQKCREEIASEKGITGKRRNSFGNLTSRNFLSNWHDHDNPPHSRTSDSSFVSREAKMKMMEKGKVTHGFIDVEEIGECSTQGEMLSTPDRKRKPQNLRYKAKKFHLSQPQRAFTKKSTGSVPKIISTQKLSETNLIDDLAKGKALVLQTPDDISNHAKGKALVSQTPDDISNLAKRMALVPQTSDDTSNPAKGKQLVPQTPEIDVVEESPLLPSDGISSTAFVVDEKVNNTDAVMFSDSSSELIPLLSACALGDGNSSVLQDVSNFQEPSNGKPEAESDALQFPVPEPEREPEPDSEISEVSKEAGDHRPVSTLEFPSTENSFSGFDSIERVNADIQELRINLNQLKTGSNDEVAFDKEGLVEGAEKQEVAFDREGLVEEAPGFDSLERVNADIQELRMHLNQLKMESDEEVGFNEEGSVEEAEVTYDEEGLFEYDYWKSTYTVDLLVLSGLYGTDPGSFISNCYSPDSPLDPSLFDVLEMNYTDEITGPKQLRNILFDHINELLVEIYQSVMESYPWVKARVGFGLMWKNGGVQEQLGNLLDNYQKEAQKNVFDTVLDNSESWYEPREVVDEIGKKIQELILDDLIKEALKM